MTFALRGSRVLLTGATGGLGAAIAHTLHARGAQLVLTGRRTDVLERLAEQTQATTVAADLASADGVRELIERAGAVDVLIANAALPGTGRLEDYSEEQLDRALDVNLRAPIVLAQAFGEQMVRAGRGHLVFIGSLSGRTASPASSMYNATKFGLRGFALALRQDLHGTGVGVSIVEPGFVADAGMFADSGMQLPPGVRTTTPQRVANGVLRGIDRNRAEVIVAPTELRLGATIGLLLPSLSAAVQRRAGAAEIAGSHQGGR